MTRPTCLALVLVALLLARPAALQTPPRWFEFRVSFWNSLHHELHALARPRAPSAVAPREDLSEAARAGWQKALEVYRPLGRRSLLFDEGLASMSARLSPLSDDAGLPREAIAPALIAALEAAAPAYRASGWPTHQRDARAFIASASSLLTRYGAVIAPTVAAAYGATWSESVPVDVVRDAGPPGNAHTTVRPRAHVTIAATDPRHQGLAALELLFHEASHGWDATLTDEITSAARAEGRVVRQDLWHAVLFYTAGELTRRALAATDTPYVPYAVVQGMTSGIYQDVWPAIVQTWTPWLDRRTSRAAAVTALVRALGELPPGAGR